MIRVLLVDDDPGLARVVGISLARAGYEVITAGSLQEARTKSGPFSVIVADVHLPNGDGRHLREDWPNVPMLVISGAPADDPPGLEKVEFLAKPFHPSSLAARLRDLVGS
jgi:two-component system OmpR family response regulator